MPKSVTAPPAPVYPRINADARAGDEGRQSLPTAIVPHFMRGANAAPIFSATVSSSSAGYAPRTSYALNMPVTGTSPSFSGSCLLRYRFGGTPDLLRVTEIVMTDRVECVIELVDQGETGRDVEPGDLIIRDIIEILDERTDAVAMGCHKDPFFRTYCWGDRPVPVRHNPAQRVFQRFGGRQLFRFQAGIPGVEPGMTGIALLKRRGPDTVPSPPQLDLLFPKLLGGLAFVQSLQDAIVTLV